ncbi:MAG: putative heavy metal efflux system protein, partial [Proteobacteria bacterium]|nr:putative heavy metal efflux system protein [Pseudomonadota bacterium]
MRSLIQLLFLTAGLLQAGTTASLESLVKLTPEQAQHIGIRTLKPEMTRREPLVRAPARVSLPPYNEYVVSAPQPGFVSKVEVALGVPVKKGQVVAIIRSPELIGLQRAVLDSSTALNLAEAKLHRDQTLLAEGIIASIRYRETKSDHDRAAMALRESEHLLAAAGVSTGEIRALKQSRRLNGELPVRSPVDGVVLERLAVTGQRVDLLAPLFRVGKLDELWLEINMPMERLGEIKLGDTVDIESVELSAR